MNFEPRKVKDEIIDEYLDAIAPAWAAMDIRAFANVDVFLYDPLIAEPWTRLHTIPMINAIKQRGIDARTVGLSLHNPSVIRCLLHYDLLMAKCAHVGIDTYLRIFTFYNDVLSAICLEDHFAKNKKNIIHNSKEIEVMAARLKPASPVIARKLGQLTSACYNLSYGLYSDMNPQLVYDNFGPYIRPDGKMFALKIFHNLKPIELWPETGTLPVDAIDISALFEGVTLQVDAATHAIYEGNQINGLRGWWCVMDGRPVEDIKEIDEARVAIEQMSIAVYTKVKSLDFESRKELYWRQKAWSYKKLFDFLGLDWLPPTEVINTARRKPTFQNWNIPKTKEESIQFMRDVFDPRKEIPQEAFKT